MHRRKHKRNLQCLQSPGQGYAQPACLAPERLTANCAWPRPMSLVPLRPPCWAEEEDWSEILSVSKKIAGGSTQQEKMCQVCKTPDAEMPALSWGAGLLVSTMIALRASRPGGGSAHSANTHALTFVLRVRHPCCFLFALAGNQDPSMHAAAFEKWKRHEAVTKGTINCRHAAAKGRLTAWVVNFRHALR